MKLPILSLITISSLATAEPAKDYLNFILQIQNDPSRTTHKIDDIDPHGSQTALDGVYGTSVFQLWTVHRSTGAEYLLDEKTVQSYEAKAQLKITSSDPYPTPRTRVDEPFKISYTVSGLQADGPDVQDAARSVTFSHHLLTFEDQKLEKTTNATSTTKDTSLDKNGTGSSLWSPSVKATNSTQSASEETFTILAKPDSGIESPTVLASAKIQVWPIASGQIAGIVAGKTYDSIPPLTLALKNLYPESSTYLAIYKGPHVPEPSGVITAVNSKVTISDSKPQSRSVKIADLNDLLTGNGEYTIAIFHETPFDPATAPMELDSITFSVNKPASE